MRIRAIDPAGVTHAAGSFPDDRDMGVVWNSPGVRTELVAKLGTNANRLNDVLQGSLDNRIGLIITPNQFRDILIGDLTKDLMGSLAGELFRINATDMGLIVEGLVIVGGAIVGAIVFGTVLSAADNYVDRRQPRYDFDGDGESNSKDKDDDSDGVDDSEDDYPFDPTRSICDCNGPDRIAFTDQNSDRVMVAVLAAFNQFVSANRTRQTVPLGSVAGAPGLNAVAVFAPGVH